MERETRISPVAELGAQMRHKNRRPTARSSGPLHSGLSPALSQPLIAKVGHRYGVAL
jgi:hypothetical protein